MKLQLLYHSQISLNRGLLILNTVYTKNRNVGLVFQKLRMALKLPNTRDKKKSMIHLCDLKYVTETLKTT
jgi:hypothetical protein